MQVMLCRVEDCDGFGASTLISSSQDIARTYTSIDNLAEWSGQENNVLHVEALHISLVEFSFQNSPTTSIGVHFRGRIGIEWFPAILHRQQRYTEDFGLRECQRNGHGTPPPDECITALDVPAGATVVLCTQAQDGHGDCYTFVRDIPSLAAVGVTHRITSVTVTLQTVQELDGIVVWEHAQYQGHSQYYVLYCTLGYFCATCRLYCERQYAQLDRFRQHILIVC
eukprot:m.1228622 g.1228622  ORF g.1228622 m.1228622 type:complete len:225 (+) comp24648_c1_seq3:405-1079(+)